MKDDKFDLMTSVIKILQKNNSNMENIIEIIDTYDDTLTAEQKAHVLDNILKHRNGSDSETKRKFYEQETAREQLRLLLKPDFSF